MFNRFLPYSLNDVSGLLSSGSGLPRSGLTVISQTPSCEPIFSVPAALLDDWRTRWSSAAVPRQLVRQRPQPGTLDFHRAHGGRAPSRGGHPKHSVVCTVFFPFKFFTIPSLGGSLVVPSVPRSRGLGLVCSSARRYREFPVSPK